MTTGRTRHRIAFLVLIASAPALAAGPESEPGTEAAPSRVEAEAANLFGQRHPVEPELEGTGHGLPVLGARERQLGRHTVDGQLCRLEHAASKVTRHANDARLRL